MKTDGGNLGKGFTELDHDDRDGWALMISPYIRVYQNFKCAYSDSVIPFSEIYS